MNKCKYVVVTFCMALVFALAPLSVFADDWNHATKPNVVNRSKYLARKMLLRAWTVDCAEQSHVDEILRSL